MSSLLIVVRSQFLARVCLKMGSYNTAKEHRMWTRIIKAQRNNPSQEENENGALISRRANAISMHAIFEGLPHPYTMLTYNMSCLRKTNVALF